MIRRLECVVCGFSIEVNDDPVGDVFARLFTREHQHPDMEQE